MKALRPYPPSRPPPQCHTPATGALGTERPSSAVQWPRWLGLGLGLVLCGCSSPPLVGPLGDNGGLQRTLAVPSAWAAHSTPGEVPPMDNNPREAMGAADWWPRFGDPLLTHLAAQAAQGNPRIQGAEAAWHLALAERAAAAAALGPSLGGTASAQRSGNGTSGVGYGTQFAIGLQGQWPLWPDRQALAASEATARARADTLNEVRVAVATELGLAYVDLRSTQARLALAARSGESQRQTLQIVLWRQQAGLVTQLDAEQARSALAQTEALLPPLRTRLQQGMHQLASLTGQPPATWQAALGPVAPLPEAPAALVLALPAATLLQRADVRAAEHTVHAAWATLAHADAALNPSFQLGGNLGLNALSLAALGQGSAVVAAVLASVAWPLFDSGAAQAQVQAQRAAFDSARINYQTTVLAALQSVEDAVVALRGDRQRLQQLRLASTSASLAANLARQRFASGLVDFQTVLETQRNELATQDSQASAQADVSADHLRLFQALGGGGLAPPATLARGMAPSSVQPGTAP